MKVVVDWGNFNWIVDEAINIIIIIIIISTPNCPNPIILILIIITQY